MWISIIASRGDWICHMELAHLCSGQNFQLHIDIGNFTLGVFRTFRLGVNRESTHDRKQQNIKELNEQLKAVEYRPRGRIFTWNHEGFKKVGIAVQKHQVWWKSRDGWWMVPEKLGCVNHQVLCKEEERFWVCFMFCQIYTRICIALKIEETFDASMVYPLLHFFQEAVWDRAAHPR